jgi:hypothetical protein
MAETILYGDREATLPEARAEGDKLWIPLEDLEGATGWRPEPRGLCRGEICVPLPPDKAGQWIDRAAGRLDFAAFASHLGHTLVREPKLAVWSFGPPVQPVPPGSGPVEAPDFVLPDLDGKLHSLSAYRGRKVFLFCWASW